MMKCEDVRSFVDAWEEGGKTLDDPGEFRAHLDGCRECHRRFGALLPLMERDYLSARAQKSAPEGLADDVMASIRSAGTRKRVFLPFHPLIAAAAAAIFVVGLGLGLFFARRGGDTVTVRFVLNAPQARSVHLAGDFNSWDGEGYKLNRAGKDGTWEIKVPLEKGKVYVYNFVLDGTTWIADPAVEATIDDGFGGSGSLLRL